MAAASVLFWLFSAGMLHPPPARWGVCGAQTLQNISAAAPAGPPRPYCFRYFAPFCSTQPRTYDTKRCVEAERAFSSFTAMPMLR